jgi:hypothetical protein
MKLEGETVEDNLFIASTSIEGGTSCGHGAWIF